MKTAFFHDGPLNHDKDGHYHNGVLNNEIIDRYFYFTDELIIATRSFTTDNSDVSTVIDHANVTFANLPNISSIKGKLLDYYKCKYMIREVINKVEFAIIRIPSQIGYIAIKECIRANVRFLVEVVGCPWDSYRSHSLLGKIIAPFEYHKQKVLIRKSSYVMYVTESFLQKRYPTNGYHIGCSDVILQDVKNEVINNRLSKINHDNKTLVLGTCGIIDIKYKGQEHVIKALSLLKRKGRIINYQLVGPGDKSRLLEIAKKYDVENQVQFLGLLKHDDVFKWLDDIDIYIQPSDTEGLCRALIEAISRGCACIASNAGGNPELVNSECVFQKRDYKQLASIIEKIINDYEFKKKIENENYIHSLNYRSDILEKKRHQFYSEIMNKHM